MGQSKYITYIGYKEKNQSNFFENVFLMNGILVFLVGANHSCLPIFSQFLA
jgi:hypothetical protein